MGRSRCFLCSPVILPSCLSSVQSMVAFLKDPSGPPLWEENPEAKDVVHLETEKVSNVLNDLLKKITPNSGLPVLTYSDDKKARKQLMGCRARLLSLLLARSLCASYVEGLISSGK